jgi:two-component system CheB/CheR fusion protein
MPESTADALDPAATDATSENARDGARKRRDPNEPAAVVGIGASAGGISPLQQFFAGMKPDTGLAFVVVMHLSPNFESQLAAVIQQKTAMPVVQVTEAVKVQPNHVYVIPPNHQLTSEDSMLRLLPPQQAQGRRVTIDLFFRTLAYAYGQRAVSIIMSGTDSDGAIGLKHIRAQGGVTIAQEPEEAEFESMPMNAINTGMVDWTMRVGDMPERLLEFVRNENAIQLPPEIPEAHEPDAKVKDAPGGETVSDETRDPGDEEALLRVLKHVLLHTGHDFGHYKRATVLRRIARRLQVNSLDSIPRYLDYLREHPPEARALLHDLLIGVTHFFRDQASFAALEANIPQLFAGKKHTEELRVWVTGCATGEEAYSIAMLLCEHAQKLSEPPSVQIFATDIDEQSIHEAREGLYPPTIEADVSPERLRQFFMRDNARYRVKKYIRDRVLFARHNVLSDPAFSRVDLVTCRNLLIYLNREAQRRVFDIFHFALRPGGLLFIGGAETADGSHSLFSPLDSHHRIYVRRSVPRSTWSVPPLPLRVAAPGRRPGDVSRSMLPVMSSTKVEEAGERTQISTYEGQGRRSVLFGELHLKLLEDYGPPSVVVNEAYDIVHLSENAGRYLAFRAGEPSTNLMTVVNPALRVELRTALFRAGQSGESVMIPGQHLLFGKETETIDLHVRPIPPGDSAQGFFLVLFEKKIEPLSDKAQATERATISREVGDQLQSLKEQLNATVEQFEVSSEELKASNEELQAMNEELRSAAEELETSKEELQSVNEELITVNHELKEKVEELSRANSDLNNLMTATDLATIFLDRQLRVVRFTPGVQELFNLLPADLGRPISDITHKLRYKTLTEDAERVLDRLASIEREIETADGCIFLVRIAPYRTVEDKISGVVLTMVDLTRVKRAEAEVREVSKQMASELHRFNTVMAAVPDFIYHFDLEGRFTYVNQPLLDLWGKTYEEAMGRNFHELDYPPHLAARLQADIQKVIKTGRSVKGEKAYARSGGMRHYEYIYVPLFAGDGRVEAVAGTTRDITDRMKATEALRESEERLRVATTSAGVFIWEVDFATGELKNSANTATVLGFPLLSKAEENFALVHPEDREPALERYRRVLAGEDVKYDSECRFISPINGEIIWARAQGQVVRDESGAATRFFGITQNTTEQKLAEAALAESQGRFRAVADNVPQLIWTNSADGTANYFNKRWFEYSGLNLEESYGLGWQAIVHPQDESASVKRWKRALAKGEVFDAEYRLRGADGEYRWFIGRNVPLCEEGEVVSWFGTATDIEDFKQAQAALQETQERFRLLVEGAPDYAMFLLDPGNRIIYWSAGAERVFGWSADEALGESGELIFTPEDRAREQEEREMQTALRKGVASDRRWHIRKDGSRVWIDGIMRRLDDGDGSVRGFAKIGRDATELHLAAEELQVSHQKLEGRVRERTAELTALNRKLKEEIKQRTQVEQELLLVSEREKRRIGQDLHDSLCQELAGAAFFLQTRAQKLEKQNPEDAQVFAEAAKVVNANVGLARDLARGLHPIELSTTGLANALRELAFRTGQLHTVECRFACPRQVRVGDEAVALNLYRITQEALTNAIKNGKAKKIAIKLTRSRRDLVLTVQDDGKGFSPGNGRRGMGIHIMKYRADVIGGRLTIESADGHGTLVTCVLSGE